VCDVLILDYGITTMFANTQWSVSGINITHASKQFKLAPCMIIESILLGRK